MLEYNSPHKELYLPKSSNVTDKAPRNASHQKKTVLKWAREFFFRFGYQKENTYLDSCQVLGVNLWQMQKNKNTHKKLVQYFHFNETMLARS